MSLADLQGSTYGPYRVRVSAEQVAAYVAATGDDVERWIEHAPPSIAGALLFTAAPSFLNAPEVAPYTKLLVHADQTFTWHRAIEVDEALTIEGTVTRVRERGGVSFVTFAASMRAGDDTVIDGVSTFLMGEGSPSNPAEELPEPAVSDRADNDPLPDRRAASVGAVKDMRRSASRLDLVRYAAASGDFNPVHFDHDTAVRAGFSGVLVHGLLMAAWITGLAATFSDRSDPVATAKFRFKNPLLPAQQATVGGDIRSVDDGGADLRMALRGSDTEYVDARITLRSG